MEDSKNYLPILRSIYPSLTKSEKRIADYINANAEQIMEKTIADLAKATDSSEITISRFCKSLGFSGLQSLKIALAREVFGTNEPPYQDISPADSYELMATKVFRNITEGLSDSLRILDYEAVEKAVKTLIKARKIDIYGFGNSATVCKDIETKFLRFGFCVHSYADAHQQATSAVLLDKNDVVFAVSHTGSTLELLESVKIARKNKAKIIVITSYANSPLAKLADIELNGMGREVHYSSEASASRLIHMAIIDVLYTGIAMKMGDKYRKNLSKMREVIAKKRN